MPLRPLGDPSLGVAGRSLTPALVGPEGLASDLDRDLHGENSNDIGSCHGRKPKPASDTHMSVPAPIGMASPAETVPSTMANSASELKAPLK